MPLVRSSWPYGKGGTNMTDPNASNTDDAFFNQQQSTRVAGGRGDGAAELAQRNKDIAAMSKKYDDDFGDFDDGDLAGTIGSTLNFPLNQSPEYDGRIEFTIHKARSAEIGIDTFLRLGFLDNVVRYGGNIRRFFDRNDNFVGDEIDYTTLSPDEVQAKEQREKEEGKSLFKGPSYSFDPSALKVNMYFPISLQVNDQVSYETPSLGLYGTLAAGAIDRGDNVLSAMAGGVASGINDVFGALIGRSDLSAEAARLVALRAAAKVPDNLGNVLRLGVQRRINPNVRAMFQGVTNLRQFAFSFDMMASSAEEAQTVQDIIKHFRTEMYPDVLDPNEDGLPIAYKFPNAFGIRFVHRGKTAKIPRLERCFLTNCDVDYGGAGTGFHPDGRPVKITMTLRFVEMRTLNKKDIEKGL